MKTKVLTGVLMLAGAALAGPHVNYDRSKIPAFTLPDPLTFVDGKKVKTDADWQRRRAEMLSILEREEYGRMPPKPEAVVTELGDEKTVLAGFAKRRIVKMWFKSDKSGPCVQWTLWRPCFAPTPTPVVLLLNYYGSHTFSKDKGIPLPLSGPFDVRLSNEFRESDRGRHENPDDACYMPLADIIARGYAVLTACYCEVSPDVNNLAKARTGVFDLWPKPQPGQRDYITSLGAWAWALQRGMDYIERDNLLDAKRVVLTGYSRLAKAALVAGAWDERFPFTAPVQTGGGGCPLNKHWFGENVATMTRSFPHWYCDNFKNWVNNEANMPFDQHFLLACVAPRALLVCGYDSQWFDTEGEYLACKAASPAWTARGKPGLPDVPFPASYDTSCIGSNLGYVRRTLAHGIAPIDWKWILDMADGLWRLK